MGRVRDERLARAMLSWHRRGSNPVSRLARQLLEQGRAEVHADAVELALGIVRRSLATARLPRSGYGRRQIAELQYIERRLDAMLCTLPYGELPAYEDFRWCLEAHGVVQRKVSTIDIAFDCFGREAEIAEEAVELTARPRALIVTHRADKSVRVTIRNAKTLYKYLLAISCIQGPTARRLGTALAKSVGYTWL